MEIRAEQIPNLEAQPARVTTCILSDDYSTLGAVREALRDCAPDCEVLVTGSLTELRSQLQQTEVDLVVIELSKIRAEGMIPLYELKLLSYEPAVVLIADTSDPQEIAKVVRAGCDRLVIKTTGWLHEIRGVLRQAFRVKKLELENRKLITNLANANEQLSSKNQRLDEYTSTLAHDIRGMISNVIMRVDLALELSKDSLTKDVSELLTRASQTGHHAIDIVKASYEFAKLGQAALSKEEVPLVALINEIVADLDLESKENINLKIGKLPTVRGNAALIKRVFLNLFANSIKYSDKESCQITITSQPSGQSKSKFELVFTDNGPGFDPETQTELFNPIWRAAHRNNSDGLGVGLSIIQRIAELHDWQVKLSSEKGQFSSFIFTVPLLKSAS